MKVPNTKPYIGQKEIDAVTEVLKSGRYVQGAKVAQFEKDFTEYIGTKYAVATNSGTSALHLSLLALGIGEGDEVIVPSMTFFATAEAVMQCGATPIFADIDPQTYCIDPQSFMDRISNKTKAVIPVHLYGHPCNMQEIWAIAEGHDLFIIEDAAQAHGAEHSEYKCGAMGHTGCFSFYATKNMTTGEGGMITTNSLETADKCRVLRNHGMIDYNTHAFLGYNYRMNDITAAIGIEQLKKLDKMNLLRQTIAALYTFTLLDNKIPWLTLPHLQKYCELHAWFWYPCKVDEFALGMSTQELVNKLKQKGIEVRNRKNLCTEQPAVQWTNPDACPVAECVAGRIIGLPIHPQLTSEEIDYVVETLKEIKP